VTESPGPNLSTLRLEIDEFNAAYAACLDDGDLSEFPKFFTEHCVYKILPRENWEQNLPVATVFAEGRSGIIDRVTGVTKTTVYRRRYLRHFISNARIRGVDGASILAGANYQVLETIPHEYTRFLNTGRYLDRFLRVGGVLKLDERLCIYDSELVPATIVYPI
jgi:3-phenylpropionate/cinnamic acid dioxygenase small subunit